MMQSLEKVLAQCRVHITVPHSLEKKTRLIVWRMHPSGTHLASPGSPVLSCVRKQHGRSLHWIVVRELG